MNKSHKNCKDFLKWLFVKPYIKAMLTLQLLFVLAAIIVGARLGGIGLGVMGGVGMAILVFVFGLQPTSPPIDVMLMIAAVISAAAAMQAAGGLDYHGKACRETSEKESLASHYHQSVGDLSVFICRRYGSCGLFGFAGDRGGCP